MVRHRKALRSAVGGQEIERFILSTTSLPDPPDPWRVRTVVIALHNAGMAPSERLVRFLVDRLYKHGFLERSAEPEREKGLAFYWYRFARKDRLSDKEGWRAGETQYERLWREP